MRATTIGEVVHSDVCGPMSCSSLGGSLYYVSFIDECSGFLRIAPIQRKSAAASEFKKFLAWLECRADCTLKRLHSDNGGEYVALEGFVVQ